MNHRTLFLSLVIALLALPVGMSNAQRIESLPGYFDFKELENIVGAETTLEVNFKGAILRMAAEAARIEDETLANMLLKLKGIQVRGYTLDRGARETLQDRISPLFRSMTDGGWDRVVRVRDDDEFVEMLIRDTTGERVEGLIVFVIGDGENETVFVNIVGEIDPEDIGRLGRRFRIGALEAL
jgi:hypothetical protein